MIITETIKTLIPLFMKFWWLWVLVLIAAFVKLIISSPAFKGKAGEKEVIKKLSSLPAEKYISLHDILISSESGTTQIDHIVLSDKGIFVIETKNYQGIISGTEKSFNWQQNIYGNKNQFKNPVHQNYGHIKALQALLPEDMDVPFYSVVAFSPKAKLNVSAENAAILYYPDIPGYIEQNGVGNALSMEKINQIKAVIADANITDKSSRRNHNKEAHMKKADTESKVESGICPRCGGNLVERTGRNGKFLGCSNYPKCKYTHNL